MTPDGGGLRDRSTFVALAGGGSRRMGRPKAFLEVGGRGLLDRVLEAGRWACSELVLVVGTDPGPFAEALRRSGWAPAEGGPETRFRREDAGLRLLRDRRPGLGPVAGLEVGLRAAGRPLCFAAACDLPFLDGAVVSALLERLDGSGAAGPGAARATVPVAGGRRQPLAAAYTVGCAAAARRCVEAGTLSMDDFLARLDEVREVPAAELALASAGPGTDPERVFLNVNRPEDLRTARRAAGEGER